MTSAVTGTTAARDPDAGRRRARLLLVVGAALGSTATVIANTVAVIAANQMLHDTVLVGATVSAGIVGAAVGTSLLATVMARRGRRIGLSLGYALGLLGGSSPQGRSTAASFPVLLLGMLLIGMTNSATQLSRYASAEMAVPEHRASAISTVVWAATAGAILGPILLPVTASVAASADVTEAVGPFVATALAAGAAGLTLMWKLRPDPDELAVPGEGVPAGSPHGSSTLAAFSMRDILRRPAVVVALVAMIVGQVVMVVIMAMTPVHMSEHGHDLTAVGIVISAHVLGMFALSPVTGRLSDQLGPIVTILLGSAVLATAGLLAAAAPPDGGLLLLVALFLLGYGWNLGFVAGSSLLTSGLEAWERTRAQGYADSLVWGSSALASLCAGFVLSAAGYAALGSSGASLLVIPVAAVLGLRARIEVGSQRQLRSCPVGPARSGAALRAGLVGCAAGAAPCAEGAAPFACREVSIKPNPGARYPTGHSSAPVKSSASSFPTWTTDESGRCCAPSVADAGGARRTSPSRQASRSRRSRVSSSVTWTRRRWVSSGASSQPSARTPASTSCGEAGSATGCSTSVMRPSAPRSRRDSRRLDGRSSRRSRSSDTASVARSTCSLHDLRRTPSASSSSRRSSTHMRRRNADSTSRHGSPMTSPKSGSAGVHVSSESS